MKTISVFTGCGGLDLGLEVAGFAPACCVEMDPYARATLLQNRPAWNLLDPGDIFSYQPEEILSHSGLRKGQASLLVGGPPCQPFSKAAFWHSGSTDRLSDRRADTLRAFLAVAAAALPEAVLIENVDGIVLRMGHDVRDLLYRTFKEINRKHNTKYDAQFLTINAADYGVPQVRRRLFILAHRDGLHLEVPAPTHSRSQEDGKEPYATAWDAIGGLDTDLRNPRLSLRGKWAALVSSIPEGENYLWHSDRGGGKQIFGWRTRYWSFLLKLAKNKPSWTITAHPGPATGPIHWKNRMLSHDEVARLQTFPLGYKLTGPRAEVWRQLGNAVPPAVGELLGNQMARQFFGKRKNSRLTLIPSRRHDCHPPEPVRRVPRKYSGLIGNHEAHPGIGKGPGAKKRLLHKHTKPRLTSTAAYSTRRK